jgi:hypothetical protein
MVVATSTNGSDTMHDGSVFQSRKIRDARNDTLGFNWPNPPIT